MFGSRSYRQKTSENAQGEHIWASREDDQAGRGGPLSKDSDIARHEQRRGFEGSTVRGRTK